MLVSPTHVGYPCASGVADERFAMLDLKIRGQASHSRKGEEQTAWNEPVLGGAMRKQTNDRTCDSCENHGQEYCPHAPTHHVREVWHDVIVTAMSGG